MGYSLPDSKRSASGLLDDYIFQIERISDHLLSAQEERDLAGSVASGSRDARNQLVQSNAKLVIRIASQYRGRGLSLEDLVGEGNLGLIRAAEEFDPQFGVRFSTYAAHWIKQSIRLALTNTSSVIRLPSHMVTLLRQWARTTDILEKRLGRLASFIEIADALELTETQRELVQKALHARGLCMETTIIEDQSAWSMDQQAAKTEEPLALIEAEEQQLQLHRRMARLDDRERAVITLRYGLHGQEILTWNEIGARLGVTREWARKIELRALAKMRTDTEHQTESGHHFHSLTHGQNKTCGKNRLSCYA